MSSPLPTQAQVVIVGGGIVGTSVAYHLTRLGWRDVLLLERRQIGCGTTWHAAGLVGQLRATQNLTRLAQYTAELYATLEQEVGQATGFMQRGSLAVAQTEGRFEELRRSASMARSFGLEVEVVGQGDLQSMWPLLNTEDLVGGVFLPKDGQTNPVDTTQALARGARDGGARIVENAEVREILVRGGRAVGVRTADAEIAAEYVVVAGGMWSRLIGRDSGVSLPVHACEHYYVVTEPMDGLGSNLPVLRDPDSCNYFKEDAGKLLVGLFEPKSKPWGMEGIPADFCFDELPADIDHFMPWLERAMQRVPALENAGIRQWFNGPESFTPDVRYLLGETPELRNLFVACGFNSIGIQSAGGAGKVLADWIVKGHPPMDLWDVDVRRMMPFQANARYLHDRVSESLGLLYAMHWPFRQYETSRGVRRSPFHDRLAGRGACFGETAGWERPNWFAPEGMTPAYEYSYGRQNWFECAAAEHRATREGVALFDLSSFAKLLVQGRDAQAALQRICANDVAVEPGHVVYTQWLNERGGIEADLTVMRLAEDRFLVMTACAVQRRDFVWLTRNLPADAHVFATDVTSAWPGLAVMGPGSRELLARLTPEDLSAQAFPFGSSREIELGYALVRATRISYVGELGWELLMPAEFATHVYDALVEAGESVGLVHAGYHAMNSLRIEKAFRHWGHDIGDEDTPIEAGLGFAVAWDKAGGFIGRDALQVAREQPLKRRLLQFLLGRPDPMLYHEEPIWRDGRIVGRTTSGMFGHTLGAPVAMGYVELEPGMSPADAAGCGYEIEVGGERIPARASLRPMYDPRGERMRV